MAQTTKNTDFEPAIINDYFVGLTKVAHGSGDEDGARKYVIECIEKMNNDDIEIIHYTANATEPGEKVIVVRKNAATGMEDKEAIVLQAHMDMVLFPKYLQPPLDIIACDESGKDGDGWIKAGGYDIESGTTLGADDGIGVATALAILSDTESKYGQIECLFTVQEETDMGGAAGFNKSLLTGRTVINLDSENVDEITYGSAGARIDSLTLNAVPEVDVDRAKTVLKIDVSGLKGGHSAMAINDEGANAIKLLVEFLTLCGISFSFARLAGGTAVNAIPDNASATIVIDSIDNDGFLKFSETYSNTVKAQYEYTDPKIAITVEKVTESVMSCFNQDTTTTVLSALMFLPHGVIRLDPNDRTKVFSSTNLASITYDENEKHFCLQTCHRSIYQTDLDVLSERQKLLANEYKWIQGDRIDFPQWQPNEKSFLLEVSRKVYRKLNNDDEPTLVVTHAGLECGWIVSKYIDESPKTIQCISIGPTILEPHGFNERLKTDTVNKSFVFLKAIINEIYYPSIT